MRFSRPCPLRRPARAPAAGVWLAVALALAAWDGRPAPAGGAPAAPAAGAGRTALQPQRAPWRLWRDGAPARTATGGARAAAEAERGAGVARRQEELLRSLGPHQISRRSLAQLARRGLGPALLAAGADPAAKAAAVYYDTLRVLLVRISFASDRSGDLTSVTTDGGFQLAPDTTVTFDPPPHDRAYFAAHLAGLAEYYSWQSQGRVTIQSTVLPLGDQDSYQLGDIADYGPGAGGAWSSEGLESLVRDMIRAADAGVPGDGVDLSEYGDGQPFTYVIFVHAGADWQSDVNGDSPNDIPTFFVSLGEAEPLAGGGALSECSIIPETTSQDGWVGSIAAGLYHEFGHALGLADLYSTRWGITQVGFWSLMDWGTNVGANVGLPTPTPDNPDSFVVESVLGLLPPSLGAWDRWFLGWLRTADCQGGSRACRLPAVQVPGSQYSVYRRFGYDFDYADPQLLVGGSPREFFLVENRWVPLTGDLLPASGGDAANVFLVRDAGTGVVLFLGGDPDGDAGPAAVRNTGMYDWFLPDGGLLVWHVNAARVDGELATNTVNWYGDGVRIVEADGIQDVGVADYFSIGFFGSANDPFHAESADPDRRRGFPGDALTQDGAPSSRAFDRSWTGLEMSAVSANDAVMTCRAGLASLAAGTPFTLPALSVAESDFLGVAPGPRALAPRSLTPFPLGGQPALVFADAPRPGDGGASCAATLFALRPDGSPVDPAPPAAAPALPHGALLRLPAPLAGPPVVYGLAAGASELELLACARRDGRITVLHPDLSAEGHAAAILSRPAGHALEWAPAAGPLSPLGDGLLACVPPDSLVLLDALLQRVGEPLALSGELGLAVRAFTAAPLWLDGGADGSRFAVFTDIGWCPVAAGPAGLDAASLQLQPYGWGAAGAAAPARAWLPGEPARLVVFGGDGAARAWERRDGRWAAASWPGALDAAPAGEPAVADVDGDGALDLVVATPRRLFAFQADGVPLRGFPAVLGELFPLPDSTRFAGDVVVADADGDGHAELLAATDLGHLIGLDAVGRLLPDLPLLWGDGGGAGLAVGAGPGQARTLWMGAPGGRTAPPLARRWVGGRLAGYALAPPAAAEARSAEWLGPGGGARRRGAEGELRDLGPQAPAAAEAGRLIVYPNPAHERRVTVRFYSASAAPARARLLNLEGELVAESAWATAAGQVNERVLDLPGLASGLYLLEVNADFGSGAGRRLTRLAVE